MQLLWTHFNALNVNRRRILSFFSSTAPPHFISFLLTERIKHHHSKVITFPHFKNLNTGKLKETLSIAPWHVDEMFHWRDVSLLWLLKKLLRTILQEHLPMKKMKVRARDVPFMTSGWKSAIRAKRKFAKRYSQNKTPQNLELKRKSRNKATRQ